MTSTKTRISKIFIVVMLCFMLCVSLFAGCNLIGEDMAKYYNATVASFTYKETGETVKVTKRELITAFNTSGYQFYQQTGDAKAAYTQTAQLLIYRKLTIRDAEEHLKEEHGGTEILTTKQKTYLYETTYESARDNIVDYFNDMNNIQDANQESSADGVVAGNNFAPTAEYVNGEIVLKNTVDDEVEDHIYFSDLTKGRDIENEEDLNALYKLVTDFVDDNPQYKGAYSRYLSDAKTSEEGMGLSKSSDSVFKRELKRIYQAVYENFMVRQYQLIYQKANSSTTIDDLLDKYKNKVMTDYTRYEIEKDAKYNDNVLDTNTEVNYFLPDEKGTQYFYVSHLLAKFTTEQESDYKLYQGIIDGKNYDSEQTRQEDTSLDEAKAQVLLDELYTEVAFPVREKRQKDDGTYEWVETGETKPAKEVAQELQLALASAGDDEYLKAEKFDEFVYKYNQDDGVFNSSRNYILGVDYHNRDEENGTSYTVRSQMVQPFTDASVALFDNGEGKIGDMYLPDESDFSTALVKTSYGVHIIVYMGRVQNLINIIDDSLNLGPNDLITLSSKQARLKAGQEKTVFDALFEEINKDEFSVFESMNLDFLLNTIDPPKFYPDEYKDLYSNLK